MYNSWVAPVLGCAMRGTVWMQGEQDRTGALAPLYGKRFQLLITSWRKLWGIGDFPFYFVQLANKASLQTKPDEGGTTAVIREGQRLALALPNTAMASAIDIGDVTQIHFPDKLDAGMRLALPAKALCYGQKNLVYSGPLYVSKTISGNKINLKFIFTGSGLTGKDNVALKGFGIAGSNGAFVFGDAVIQGDIVSVSSPSVSAPTQVYYGYATNPIGNLYNKEGLPASPFLTTSPDLEVAVAVAQRPSMTLAARPANGNISFQGFFVNALGCKTASRPVSTTQILWYRADEKAQGRIVFKNNRFFREESDR
jgi:sialate O-acetylesterase